jgi:predicted PurR-regulated permease PerM
MSKKRSKSRAAKSKKTAAGQSVKTEQGREKTIVDKSIQRVANEPIFAQYFSFSLLLIAIVLVGILFYEVMAAFWIPLFLAAVLVVVFRPWYNWIRQRLNVRDWMAAAMTAISVLLIVLGPLGLLLFLAAVESQQVLQQLNSTQVIENASQVRDKLGLDLPEPVVLAQANIQLLMDQSTLSGETMELHQTALFEIEYQAQELAELWELPKPETVMADVKEDSEPSNGVTIDLVAGRWDAFIRQLAVVRQQYDDLGWDVENASEALEIDGLPEVDVRKQQLTKFHDYKLEVGDLATAFNDVKVERNGGKVAAWVATLLNPSEKQVDGYLEEATSYFGDKLVFLGGKSITFLVLIVVGAIVMVAAFYFFLLDGQSMIEAFKRLSPLDDEHEQELVAEFSSVSRAVVVATLLSALVQGLLAGLGFYFVGIESIFLLTVLSAVLAMVPFLGAASVWVPCALYLYLVDNNLAGAIGLAVYGAAVISMADNVIKPLVLHGHSKLHPLFAFLSVIGGVAALGPIGILIGPMIVAFLQTLLEILQNEMAAMDQAAD